MRTFITGIFCMVLMGCIGAGSVSPIVQTKDGYFPIVQGIDLQGNERAIPSSFKGKRRIVTIGFERDHQNDINTWITIAEDIMTQHNDISFYELPVIDEVSAMYRTWINNGMRSGIEDEVARERTITVYTDRTMFVDSLQMKTDRIYVLLLDQDGKIVWRAEGPTTLANIDALKQIVDTP